MTDQPKQNERSREATCSTCRFYSSNGECRKFAPRVVTDATGGLLFAGTGFMSGGVRHGWPCVSSDDWCGEYSSNTELTTPKDVVE